MEAFSSIKLEDIYDENVADIFIIVMSVIGYIGIASSFTVFFIIFFKSPTSMKRFRFCLLCYVFFNFLAELVILLYKPIYIPKFIILYPRGLLSPMNDITSKLLLGLIFTSGFGILAVFIILLIERYAAMSFHESLAAKNFYKHPSFYTFVQWSILTFLIITVFLFFFLVKVFHPVKDTFEVIQKYVVDGQKLLDFQPNLLRVNQEIIKYLAPLFFIAFLIFITLLIVFFSLCSCSVKQFSSKFSQKVLNNNRMLFRSICFQFLAVISFIIIPITGIMTVILLNISSKYTFYFAMAVIWTFPIVDNVVIISTITPYRKFITGKLHWLKTTSII